MARKEPSGPSFTAFLIWPRMPDTVRMDAPMNFATSISELNMPRMNAVFLNILLG